MKILPPTFNQVITATSKMHRDPCPEGNDPKWFFYRGKRKEKMRLNGNACSKMLRQGLLKRVGFDEDGCEIFSYRG